MFTKLQLDNRPSKYSINLMWINQSLNTNNPYIFGCQSEDQIIDKVLNKARKWKKANPEAEVILWYDSKFITDKALENTQAVLIKKIKEDPSFAFKLKDIQQIDFVDQNPDVFSDNLPIYFRVDVLKLILCIHSILSDGMDAAIFSDLEVGDLRQNKDRMDKKELFNTQIMKRLETIGIQVNTDGMKDENQFLQILNKPSTINAIKIYINACLSRAITALNCTDQDFRDYELIPDLCTSVFNMMTDQLFQLIEMGAYNKEILVRADLSEPLCKWVKYDMAEHGYLPLGNLFLRKYNSCYYLPPGVDIKPKNIISYRELIQFKVLSYDCKFSRDDMKTRGGGNHSENMKKLISRPADGSNTYKFHAWEIIKDPILSPKVSPEKK